VENTNLYKSTASRKNKERLYEAASEQSSHTSREGASAPPCTYPARKNKNKYYLSRIGSIWLLILKLKPCWIKQKSLRKSR
jgi:hypothetical protein